MNSLTTAAAQAHIDDLLRSADHGRLARGAAARRVRLGSLRNLVRR